MMITEAVTAVPQMLGAVPMDGGGILDWVGAKSGQARSTLQQVSILVAVVMFVMIAVKGGFTVTKMVMGGITAAVFLYIVFNVTSLRDRVKDETDSAGLHDRVVLTAAAPAATGESALD